MCLGVVLLGSNFFGTLWVFYTSWKSISFAIMGKFSFIIYSNKFSISCSSCFQHPHDSDIGIPKVVAEVPKPLLIFSEVLFLHSVQVVCFFLPSGPNH